MSENLDPKAANDVLPQVSIIVEAPTPEAADLLSALYGGGNELLLLSEAVQAGAEVVFTTPDRKLP